MKIAEDERGLEPKGLERLIFRGKECDTLFEKTKRIMQPGKSVLYAKGCALPDWKDIPGNGILKETRKGVALCYTNEKSRIKKECPYEDTKIL